MGSRGLCNPTSTQAEGVLTLIWTVNTAYIRVLLMANTRSSVIAIRLLVKRPPVHNACLVDQNITEQLHCLLKLREV